jgi:hypothetical protein
MQKEALHILCPVTGKKRHFSVTYDVDRTILAESPRRKGVWKVFYQSVLLIQSYTDGHTTHPMSIVSGFLCTCSRMYFSLLK